MEAERELEGGGGEVSGKLFLLYWPCSCLCTSLQPVSERDRCPQNSCPCPCVVFSFFYCSFFLSRPPFCISSIQLTTPPQCNFCVTHFTNTHTSSSTQWAAKLVHEVSCSYHYISIGVSQYECVCASLSAVPWIPALFTVWPLFSLLSLSPGPWQLLSQCFPLRAPGREGDGVWRERGREGEKEWEHEEKIFKTILGWWDTPRFPTAVKEARRWGSRTDTGEQHENHIL